jgi:hypothetical protein
MALFSPVPPRQPLFTPARSAEPGLFTAPLFTSGPATGATAQPLPAPAQPPPAPPSMGLPLKFAHALQSFLAEEASLYAEGADPVEARQLPLRLLEEYEKCCGDELKRLRAELQRSDQASAAALTAECELLRGERNSWSLLRWLYCDWEGRQLPPPAFPEPPEDWGRALRELGPEVRARRRATPVAAPRPSPRHARRRATPVAAPRPSPRHARPAPAPPPPPPTPPPPTPAPTCRPRRCSTWRPGSPTSPASPGGEPRRRRVSPRPPPTRVCKISPNTATYLRLARTRTRTLTLTRTRTGTQTRTRTRCGRAHPA